MFQSHMSTHKALNISPFMWYDASLAVKIGNNSLNLAQAHLTLALAASPTPPAAPSVSPKKQNLGTCSNFTLGSITTSFSKTDWTWFPIKHLLQWKSTLLCNFHKMPLHPLWIQLRRPRLNCVQLLSCKHYMDILQNLCSPDTTWPQ